MKQWYVALTWHDWPDGGSYATEVEAADAGAAEAKAREEMGLALAEERGTGPEDMTDTLNAIWENEQVDWYLVLAFPIDEFIAQHTTEKAMTKGQVATLLPPKTQHLLQMRRVTIERVMEMTEKELTRLPGIGPARAHNIWTTIHNQEKTNG